MNIEKLYYCKEIIIDGKDFNDIDQKIKKMKKKDPGEKIDKI